MASRYSRLVAVSIVIATLAVEIPLILHKSAYPVLLGRYSLRAMAVIVALGVGGAVFASLSLRSLKATQRITVAIASGLVSIMLVELGVRLIASRSPDTLWHHLPYTVKRATIESRDRIAMAHDYIEWDGMDVWYKPYSCVDRDAAGGDPGETVSFCYDEIGFRNPVGTFSGNEQI